MLTEEVGATYLGVESDNLGMFLPTARTQHLYLSVVRTGESQEGTDSEVVLEIVVVGLNARHSLQLHSDQDL